MTDYRSLEQKIRQLWIEEANRNSEIRKKVANVGRPDDNVKDETSKLAKQGEIKTKIIDEAIDQQTDGSFMKDKDNLSKKKPDAQSEDDPREIKGGKTEVDLKPVTNDKVEDTTKEDEISKKARNKVNKEIGAKGVKEETMSEKNFGLPESLIQTVNEVLKGNQSKIDANHNGKIDAQDFKILRGKKKTMKEGACPKCGMNPCRCTKNEEVEDIDEASYSAKSARAGKDIGKPGKNFEKIAKSAGAKYGSKEAGERVAGAVLAKLRKEEVEFSTEELARIEEIVKGL